MQKNRIWYSLYNNKVVQNLVPWALFLIMLMQSWRVKDFFHAVSGYGDVLEILWGIRWYAQQWLHFRSAAVFPMIFYPVGFHVATLAHTPFTFILLIPLYLIGGEAFAYNVATMLSLVIAFGGMYRLARRYGGTWLSATLAALLFTFWGFRWIRVSGHLHVLLGSALLPWLLLTLDHAWNTSRHANRWFVAAGAVWAMSIMNLYYFALIDGVVVAVWMFVQTWCGGKDWVRLIRGLLITGVAALVLSMPGIAAFLKAKSASNMTFYVVEQVSYWGASLNSLPIPCVLHPHLGKIAQKLYSASIDESGVANLGTVAFIVACIGMCYTWRDRKWRPVHALVVVGLLLGMGLVLRWDGKIPQSCGLCKPVNQLIWRLGHFMKPDFFTTGTPAPPFDRAFPLPGLLLAAVVPLWEGARVLARYVLIASAGFFLLVAQGIQRLKPPWLQALLAVLLLFEFIPPISGNVPANPPTHAAFEWIQQNTLLDDSVIDLTPVGENLVSTPLRGEVLWATLYHERASVSGVGSYLPSQADSLYGWLYAHPHAFQNPDLIPMLRFYRADYILLHMEGKNAQGVLEEARANHEIEFIDCFNPPATSSPWNYSICVLRILPSENFVPDILRISGWSSLESWGVWAEGTTSRALWIAAAQTDMLFSVEAFPHCVPEKSQSISIQVNGVPLATHQWEECESWSTQIAIPAALVKSGINDLTFEYAYAARPMDVTGGANPDLRQLSVGFTKLQLVPVP
ncbi:MAG: hypothetical protein JXA21_21805 [Anaerolineae bacterium]|nr:hypothetical protein [Anaerolineae bacterium]